jgi:hypothetical protein
MLTVISKHRTNAIKNYHKFVEIFINKKTVRIRVEISISYDEHRDV